MFSTWLLQSNILAQQYQKQQRGLTVGENLAEDLLIDQFLQGDIDAQTLLQEDDKIPLLQQQMVAQELLQRTNNNSAEYLNPVPTPQDASSTSQIMITDETNNQHDTNLNGVSAFAYSNNLSSLAQQQQQQQLSAALFQKLLLEQQQATLTPPRAMPASAYNDLQLQQQLHMQQQFPLQGEKKRSLVASSSSASSSASASPASQATVTTASSLAVKKQSAGATRKRKAGSAEKQRIERNDKDSKVQKTADIFNKIRCLNCNIEWERAAYRNFEQTTILPNDPKKYKFSAKKRQCERCAKKLQQIRYVCKFCNSEFAHDAKTKHSLECIESHTLAPSAAIHQMFGNSNAMMQQAANNNNNNTSSGNSESSSLASPDNNHQQQQQHMQQLLMQALVQQQQHQQQHSPVPTKCGITLGSIQDLQGGVLAQVTAHQQVKISGQFNTCDKFKPASSWICYIRHQVAASLVSVNMIQDANGFFQITIPYFPQDGNLEVKTVCHMCKSQSNSIKIFYAMPHDILEMLNELEDDITGSVSDDLAAQVDGQNRNVLHYACSYQRSDVLNLVSQRVSPHLIIDLMNSTDVNGNTPWQMATTFIPFHAQAAWQAKVKEFINKATLDALAIEEEEEEDEDDHEEAEIDSPIAAPVQADSDIHERSSNNAPQQKQQPQQPTPQQPSSGGSAGNAAKLNEEAQPLQRRQLQRPLAVQQQQNTVAPPKSQSVFDNSGIFDSVLLYDEQIEYQKFNAPQCTTAKAELHAPNTLNFFHSDTAFVMHKPDLVFTVHTVEAHDNLRKFEIKSNASTESLIIAPSQKYEQWRQCLSKVATKFVKMDK